MEDMSWDPVWEKVFSSQEWGKYPAESLIRFIARNFYKKKRREVRLLEIGCGTGANLWYICREGFDVYGIDGSKEAVRIATSRLKKEELSANIVVGDFSKIPYADNFFDAVIDVEALYANPWDSSKKILIEVNRVLKQDGLFYSRTFADDMYVGTSHPKTNNLEYNDIDDGPFEGKGFARLVDEKKIDELYGSIFKIQSVDKLIETQHNQKFKVSEFIIVCQK